MKTFNTEGACIPSLHYMVNIDQTLLQIRSLIGKGKYFTINRARQFGKTTTLAQVRTRYNKEYVILSLDFQGIGNAGFSSEEAFAQEFCRLIRREKLSGVVIPNEIDAAFAEYQSGEPQKVRLGEQQILEYMNHFDLTTGYMLSFNFNQHKEQGVKRVMIGNRVLFEGML